MTESTVHEIAAILRKTFNPLSLEIVDDSARHASHAEAKKSGGGHYQVHINATIFKDKSRLESHRIIHSALAPLFKSGAIHALSLHLINNA